MLMISDLKKIADESSDIIKQQFTENIIQNFFWEEQVKLLKEKDKKQIIWDLMFIKWCLSLKLVSSSALRSSNVTILPSERTLRDYTHFIKA